MKHYAFHRKVFQGITVPKLPFSWIITAGFLYFTWRCFSILFRAQGVDVIKSFVSPNGNWLFDFRTGTVKMN